MAIDIRGSYLIEYIAPKVTKRLNAKDHRSPLVTVFDTNFNIFDTLRLQAIV